MTTPSLYDDVSLEKQASLQRDHTWDLERDIPWAQGVDVSKYFLPLDADAIAFPGLSSEQRRVFSQFLGLLINATIAEMEAAIDRLKQVAWADLLRRYPVNPEMEALGELFFEEEKKHARAFVRFQETFCAQTGVSKDDFDRLMPKAVGSFLFSTIRSNAAKGGFAFWWIVAAVEEVSVQVYQTMHKHQPTLDPLYFTVHRRHLEDEARHRNYAFLMLELAHQSPTSWKRRLLHKTDFLLAQGLTASWMLTEFQRFYTVSDLQSKHPFFATLASCVPALKSLRPWEIVRRLFVTAPYVSFVLNTHHQRQTVRFAEKFGIWKLPLPRPRLGGVFTEVET